MKTDKKEVALGGEEKQTVSPKETKRKKSLAKTKTEVVTDLSPSEIESLIVSLSNQGHSMSEIGLLLRDQHNVFKTHVVVNKTISQVLAEHQLLPEIPEDLLSLIQKVVALDSHLQKNKKDFSAKRGYQLTVSKIRRLVDYYHKTNRLPKKWRYTIETARLLVK